MRSLWVVMSKRCMIFLMHTAEPYMKTMDPITAPATEVKAVSKELRTEMNAVPKVLTAGRSGTNRRTLES